MKRKPALRLVGMLCAVMLLSAACATTHQTRSAKKSGFLGDYSSLQKGGSGEAQLIYINPNADFGKYKKVLIEPIAIYTSKKSKLVKIPRKDRQALVDYLSAAVYLELKKDYQIVGHPGEDVLAVRIALTEAKGSSVVLDTLSSVIPVGIAISALKRVAVGTHSSVGLARVEAEVVDSVTRQRLMAAVDERAGRKYTGRFDKWSKWEDARDAYDYWAEKLRTRLAELRSGS